MWKLGLSGSLLVTGALLVALLVWYVFFMRARVGDVGVSFFGAAYTGLLLSSLILVRMSLPGIWGWRARVRHFLQRVGERLVRIFGGKQIRQA